MERFLLKEFAKTPTIQTGVYGSEIQGNATLSEDYTTIQSGTAWEQGIGGATSNALEQPALNDDQGVYKVLCKAIKNGQVSGIPLWINTETYYKGSICLIVSNDIPYLYYSLTDNNIGNNPLNDTINWRILITNDTVGTIKFFAGSTIPDGWLKCDGSELLISDYQELYNVIGILYGTPSDNQHFLLPDFINRFAQGGDSVGSYIEAGLPNITGSFYAWDGNYSGAFYKAEQRIASATQNASQSAYVNFDASRSSSIYGNSTTVQPSALTVNFIIKY